MLVAAGRAFKSAIVEISDETDMGLQVLDAIRGMIHDWARKMTLSQSQCEVGMTAYPNARG
jgi:hypothetical protein